jgi:hypothetical protein
MQLQRAKPPTSGSVSFELGLAAFKRVLGDVPENVQTAQSLTTSFLAVLDRVNVPSGKGSSSLSFLASLSERYSWEWTQTHFSADAMYSHSDEPLSAAITSLVEPQTAAIAMLADRQSFESRKCKFVQCPQVSVHPIIHPLYMDHGETE